VCILMIGAVFSPRAVVGARRGASPRAHCAVNAVLHRDGRRVGWVFTERPGARIEDDGRRLVVGASSLRYRDDGRVQVVVDERTAPWGRPLGFSAILDAHAPPAPELALDAAGRHRWEARVPRATATLLLPSGEAVTGVGYHDTNHGDVPLGTDLPGWRWSRVHGPSATTVRYVRPGPELEVTATAARTTWRERAPTDEPLVRTGWGLDVPDAIRAGAEVVGVAARLESSPFYARLAGQARGRHAIAEVADFRRFRSPLVRWMAHFRMRVERPA